MLLVCALACVLAADAAVLRRKPRTLGLIKYVAKPLALGLLGKCKNLANNACKSITIESEYKNVKLLINYGS